jgi:hypothetical protein
LACLEFLLRYTTAMHKTINASISVSGQVTLLEPLDLVTAHRALVTILEPLPRKKMRSKYAGAFSSDFSDTSEKVDELLAIGFAK